MKTGWGEGNVPSSSFGLGGRQRTRPLLRVVQEERREDGPRHGRVEVVETVPTWPLRDAPTRPPTRSQAHTSVPENKVIHREGELHDEFRFHMSRHLNVGVPHTLIDLLTGIDRR